MSQCPCGSELEYDKCCEPIIKGEVKAQSPEKLMRSRYSAYVKVDIDYLENSTHPDHREDFDPESTRSWAKESTWQKLDILTTSGGGADDTKGSVEFVAYFTKKGEEQAHHELATFKKEDDTWYFEDGVPGTAETFVRETPKVGRNEPCPCGSGKKI